MNRGRAGVPTGAVVESHPLATLATLAVGGALDAALGARLGWSAAAPAYLLFGAAAAVVSVSDLRSRRVPNRAVIAVWAGGAALLAAAGAVDGAFGPLARAGIASGALAAFYLALALAFPGGAGMGDVKWAAVVGLYLGWVSWSAVFLGAMTGFAAASLFVAPCRWRRSCRSAPSSRCSCCGRPGRPPLAQRAVSATRSARARLPTTFRKRRLGLDTATTAVPVAAS